MLDMDGVLCSFRRGILIHHNIDPDSVTWSPTEGIEAILAYVPDIWKGITWKFWAGLEKMSDTDVILGIISKYFKDEDVYLVTCLPSIEDSRLENDPESFLGKYFWAQSNVPHYFPNMVICNCKKRFAAAPEHILIDDSDYQIDAFEEEGGTGILLPRPWNTKAHLDASKHLRNALDLLFNKVCLKCQQPFMSEGNFNRICPKCNKENTKIHIYNEPPECETENF